MRDDRRLWQIRKDGLFRFLAWHQLFRDYGDILVAEFPKSGGTWFCQMLSELLGMPFPRNKKITKQNSILHGHYSFSKRFFRPIHIMRDGRDVMVSAYHYFLLNEEISTKTRERWRDRMGNEGLHQVTENLAQFIHVFHKQYTVSFRKSLWAEYISEYLRAKNVLTLKYEDLQDRPVSALVKALEWLDFPADSDHILSVIAKYDFQNMSGRAQGEEAPTRFMRKGIVGDWKNYFNKESSEVFAYYAGEALIFAGYEQNADWIR